MASYPAPALAPVMTNVLPAREPSRLGVQPSGPNGRRFDFVTPDSIGCHLRHVLSDDSTHVCTSDAHCRSGTLVRVTIAVADGRFQGNLDRTKYEQDCVSFILDRDGPGLGPERTG